MIINDHITSGLTIEAKTLEVWPSLFGAHKSAIKLQNRLQ